MKKIIIFAGGGLFSLFIIILLIMTVLSPVQTFLNVLENFFNPSDKVYVERWLNREQPKLESFRPDDCVNFRLAESTACYYFVLNKGNSIIPVGNKADYVEYLSCFDSRDNDECFSNISSYFSVSEDDKSKIKNMTRALQNALSDKWGSGGVLEIDGIEIDFESKYYNFSTDRSEGNPCVCSLANGIAWPFARCDSPTNQGGGLSTTGAWNKMICTSYASGRYWEVHYPDDPFPLPLNWDQILTISQYACGAGSHSLDPNNPIPQSILSIKYGSNYHDAFIEGVGSDGSVVISECNAGGDNEYGFKVSRYSSLQEYLNSFSPNATVNGMYGN